jgi:alkylhydroperoxidase family enzyme
VSDEDIAAAPDAGLSDAALADIVGHVALNTLTNYFNNAFDTEVDSPLVEPATDARDALARRAA